MELNLQVDPAPDVRSPTDTMAPPLPPREHRTSTDPDQLQVSAERMRPISQGKFNLLQPTIRKIASENDLNYEVQSKNDEAHVVFRGNEVTTLKAAAHILGECNDIREDTVELDDMLIKLLGHDSALEKLQARIDEEFTRANVYISTRGKLRLAINADEFQAASELIFGCFSRQDTGMGTGEIENVKALLRHNPFVAVADDPNSPTIHVIGFADEVEPIMNPLRVAKPPVPELRPMTNQMYDVVQLYFPHVNLQPVPTEHGIQVEVLGADKRAQASVRRRIQQVLTSVGDEEIEVPEYVLRLLEDERKMQELKRRCYEQQARFRAALYLCENGSLRAVCKHEELNAVTKFVNETFTEYYIPLEDATKQYVNGDEWQDVKKAIQNHGKVSIELQDTLIIVRGFEDSVKTERITLKDVLEGKHVRTESVVISNPAEFRFLRGQQREQLDGIAEACDVKLKYMEPGDEPYGKKAEIHITGKIEKVDLAMELVNDLRDKIVKNVIYKTTKYGMAEYFRHTQDGRGDLLAIEDKWKVAVDVTATRGLSLHVTADNVHVAVGDVTRETCDVLVCSVANGDDDLSRCGAVAKAFAEAGGTALQQAFSSLRGVAEGKVHQAACTGNLQCKALLFLGVRDWNGQSSKQMLCRGVSECVRACDAMGYSSIGFPTIGCGKMGYPPVEFASCILQAASLYPAIKVHVIAVSEDATFASIKLALKPTDLDANQDWGTPDYDLPVSTFGRGSQVSRYEGPGPTDRGSSAYTSPGEAGYESYVPAAQPSPASGQSRPPSCPPASWGTLNIPASVVPSNLTVIEANIVHVKADALVITLGQAEQDLRKCGVVARVFHEAIGSKKLQRDFSKVGGNGLTLGEVAVSKLENVLWCKRLLYLGLAHWTKTPTLQVIVDAIESCLRVAKVLGMRTIAFPALGTGNLNFPPATVAKCFIQAAQKFPQMRIIIVTYRNPFVLNQVRNVLATRAQSAPKNLTLERGDITQMKCDVMVNTVRKNNRDLNQCGALSKAFVNALGPKVQSDFKKTKGLGVGEISAYKVDQKKRKLMCHVLLHLGLDRWGEMKDEHIIKGIAECIKFAEGKGYTSIAFPALGTGHLNTPPAVLADCFMDCADTYPRMQIHLVVMQDEVYTEIANRLKGPLPPPPPPRPLSVPPHQLPGTAEDMTYEGLTIDTDYSYLYLLTDSAHPAITFTIYGADQDATSNAKKELGEVVARKHKEKELRSTEWPVLDFLPHLPQNFTSQLPRWCSKLAHVAYDGRTIRIMGEAEEVNKLYGSVVEALEKEAARIDGALIRRVRGEKAYFSHLARLEPRTPETWTKYPNYGDAGKVDGTTGDHFLVDLDEDLSKSSVEQLMKKSWDLKENFAITKIQRIENPKLYFRYMNYKKTVCARVADTSIQPLGKVHTATLGLDTLHEDLHCEVNEYLFFHGTTSDGVEAVGAQNFDARLASNGFFGKGIYLAEMAAKSHQYTARDREDREISRKMLIVRAVLGNSFVSQEKKPELVRPPCRQCTDPKCTHTDLYDSVTGKPSKSSSYREFILYGNDMCYPLYCVTYQLTK